MSAMRTADKYLGSAAVPELLSSTWNSYSLLSEGGKGEGGSCIEWSPGFGDHAGERVFLLRRESCVPRTFPSPPRAETASLGVSRWRLEALLLVYFLAMSWEIPSAFSVLYAMLRRDAERT